MSVDTALIAFVLGLVWIGVLVTFIARTLAPKRDEGREMFCRGYVAAMEDIQRAPVVPMTRREWRRWAERAHDRHRRYGE